MFTRSVSLLLSGISTFSLSPLLAQETDTSATPEEIIVSSPRARAIEAGMLADTIQQTEVLSSGLLADRQAVTLSEALTFSPGIRVNNECSMCGVKRIMLNGLAGHHTTILLDGLPAHTMVSGFYGPDAMSTAGVERIEIARGAGASLTAPEAIGGSINIVTKEPTESELELDLGLGLDGMVKGSATGYFVSEDGRTRFTVASQYSDDHQQDNDDNGVSESPALTNYSVTTRLSQDIGSDSTLILRVGYLDSEIFGGPVLGEIDGADSVEQIIADYDGIDSESLFEGDNVNNQYIGKAWETTEWISTERIEVAGSFFTSFSDELNMEVAASFSEHKQDSFYEGIDYVADNDMLYLDGKVNYSLGEDNLLTLGISLRDETLESESVEMSSLPDYVSDSFDYKTQSAYIQNTWNGLENLEVAAAVRLDHVKADFTSPLKPGVEIKSTLVSPRVDIRYHHNDYFTSRVSAGRGYRAPLSFFETDHGILDAGLGFAIEVDELEKSFSTSYALSYSGDTVNVTAAIAHTAVENLAGLGENEDGVPTLEQLDETGRVTALSVEAGWQATPNLHISGTVETFWHDSVMRSMFGIAPAEERAMVGLSYKKDRWNMRLDAVWTGGRDLTKYGYEGYADALATTEKPTYAPAYITVDARIAYRATETIELYAGAKNLTNYTQATKSSSPLFYDADGGYDVAYIYGPLHGEEIYFGASAKF